jgi:hypothetical protein
MRCASLALSVLAQPEAQEVKLLSSNDGANRAKGKPHPQLSGAAMSVLADWKKHKRFIADVKQQKRRELILEWYKLLKPFDRLHSREREKLLGALADTLSRGAISSVVSAFVWLGGAWTAVIALLFLVAHRSQWWALATLFALGIVGVLMFAFKFMRDQMRYRLDEYATGWWVAHDPFTGKEVYELMKCPRCRRDEYLRYLEPCKYCGHNIDWKAAKLP